MLLGTTQTYYIYTDSFSLSNLANNLFANAENTTFLMACLTVEEQSFLRLTQWNQSKYLNFIVRAISMRENNCAFTMDLPNLRRKKNNSTK